MNIAKIVKRFWIETISIPGFPCLNMLIVNFMLFVYCLHSVEQEVIVTKGRFMNNKGIK